MVNKQIRVSDWTLKLLKEEKERGKLRSYDAVLERLIKNGKTLRRLKK